MNRVGLAVEKTNLVQELRGRPIPNPQFYFLRRYPFTGPLLGVGQTPTKKSQLFYTFFRRHIS